MSEEEIIRNVKRIIEYKVISNYINDNDSRAIQGLLDLYNKEKEKNKELEKYKKYYETEKVVWSRKDYISKDKIIEILGLEENDDMTEKGILDYIDILVSENARLEDIEDKKVQIEYQNVFNKGVKSVKDKVREKIEKRKTRLVNGKKSYTNKIRINELNLLSKELLQEGE